MSADTRGDHAANHAAHHVVGVRIYATILFALLVLTGITVFVAFQEMGPLNDLVAMAIAVFKATLVVLFFMHVKYSTSLTKVIVISSIVWLLLLFAFVLADTNTRELLNLPGRPPTL